MATVSRIECPKCSALCMDGETNCWQCSALLKPPPLKPAELAPSPDAPKRGFTLRFALPPRPAPTKEQAPEPPAELIRFDPEHTSSTTVPLVDNAEGPEAAFTQDGTIPLPPVAPQKQVRMTLTGEVVEEEDPVLPAAPEPGVTMPLAATIGGEQIAKPEEEEVMTLTFCKECGFENEPGKKKCAKCGELLQVIAVKDYKPMEGLARAWGFDVLAGVWIILGIAAIFAGQFLLQTDPEGAKPSLADYLWTGVVAIAPGVMVIMRHHVCRVIFWVMTVGSIMVWTVLFVVWITGHLHVSAKGQVGLTWLLSLSVLSAVSFFLVRTNDAFDYEFSPWLGRE